MTDISFPHWNYKSDTALSKLIGDFIRHHRMGKSKTQEVLAAEAGISRSTLSLLERGETVSVATLIRVLRVLNQLQVMDVFRVSENMSPPAVVRFEKQRRKRARGKRDEATEQPGGKR